MVAAVVAIWLRNRDILRDVYDYSTLIGAAGKTGDDRADGQPTHGRSGFDVVGQVAKECMARGETPLPALKRMIVQPGRNNPPSLPTYCCDACAVHVPLMVVKQPWQPNLPDGLRNPIGRVLRYGRNGQPGLNIFVCVDSSRLSQQAFSFAASLLRRDDRLVCLHVTNMGTDKGRNEREDEAVRVAFAVECGKLACVVPGLQGADYITTPHYKTTIADDILEYVEEKKAGMGTVPDRGGWGWAWEPRRGGIAWAGGRG